MTARVLPHPKGEHQNIKGGQLQQSHQTEGLVRARVHSSSLPETPNTGRFGRLFCCTSSRIELAARFFVGASGVDGSGRSMNNRLGRVSGASPILRRHARGTQQMSPLKMPDGCLSILFKSQSNHHKWHRIRCIRSSATNSRIFVFNTLSQSQNARVRQAQGMR